jgi:hypothetical protein
MQGLALGSEEIRELPVVVLVELLFPVGFASALQSFTWGHNVGLCVHKLMDKAKFNGLDHAASTARIVCSVIKAVGGL